MIKNLLLALSICVAIWFSALAVFDLWNYRKLEAASPATIRKIKVVPVSESSYKLKIYYSFLEGKKKGAATLQGPYYMNRPSAEKAAETMKGRAWQAYFDPKNPSRSSVQRLFPYKYIFYSLMSLGVALYFWRLSRYAETFSKSL